VKIRTTEHLYDSISADLGWRKKELSVFKGQVEKADTGIRPALLRSSIALLYAHWEGFVKGCAHAYLCYLASLRLTHGQLRPELVALTMKARINEFETTNKALIHSTLVRDIREGANSRAKIPTNREAVRTFSNLNYERLCDILCSVGCDFSRYAIYQDLIDDQLLASRNRIAHGEEDYISLTDWNDVRVEVIKMMDDVSNQFLNSANQRSYLAQRETSGGN
jgi:hypothetical protein